MAKKAEKQVPQVINFDGKQYDISKMTDRVAEPVSYTHLTLPTKA